MTTAFTYLANWVSLIWEWLNSTYIADCPFSLGDLLMIPFVLTVGISAFKVVTGATESGLLRGSKSSERRPKNYSNN